MNYEGIQCGIIHEISLKNKKFFSEAYYSSETASNSTTKAKNKIPPTKQLLRKNAIKFPAVKVSSPKKGFNQNPKKASKSPPKKSAKQIDTQPEKQAGEFTNEQVSPGAPPSLELAGNQIIQELFENPPTTQQAEVQSDTLITQQSVENFNKQEQTKSLLSQIHSEPLSNLQQFSVINNSSAAHVAGQNRNVEEPLPNENTNFKQRLSNESSRIRLEGAPSKLKTNGKVSKQDYYQVNSNTNFHTDNNFSSSSSIQASSAAHDSPEFNKTSLISGPIHTSYPEIPASKGPTEPNHIDESSKSLQKQIEKTFKLAQSNACYQSSKILRSLSESNDQQISDNHSENKTNLSLVKSYLEQNLQTSCEDLEDSVLKALDVAFQRNLEVANTSINILKDLANRSLSNVESSYKSFLELSNSTTYTEATNQALIEEEAFSIFLLFKNQKGSYIKESYKQENISHPDYLSKGANLQLEKRNYKEQFNDIYKLANLNIDKDSAGYGYDKILVTLSDSNQRIVSKNFCKQGNNFSPSQPIQLLNQEVDLNFQKISTELNDIVLKAQGGHSSVGTQTDLIHQIGENESSYLNEELTNLFKRAHKHSQTNIRGDLDELESENTDKVFKSIQNNDISEQSVEKLDSSTTNNIEVGSKSTILRDIQENSQEVIDFKSIRGNRKRASSLWFKEKDKYPYEIYEANKKRTPDTDWAIYGRPRPQIKSRTYCSANIYGPKSWPSHCYYEINEVSGVENNEFFKEELEVNENAIQLVEKVAERVNKDLNESLSESEIESVDQILNGGLYESIAETVSEKAAETIDKSLSENLLELQNYKDALQSHSIESCSKTQLKGESNMPISLESDQNVSLGKVLKDIQDKTASDQPSVNNNYTQNEKLETVYKSKFPTELLLELEEVFLKREKINDTNCDNVEDLRSSDKKTKLTKSDETERRFSSSYKQSNSITRSQVEIMENVNDPSNIEPSFNFGIDSVCQLTSSSQNSQAVYNYKHIGSNTSERCETPESTSLPNGNLLIYAGLTSSKSTVINPEIDTTHRIIKKYKIKPERLIIDKYVLPNYEGLEDMKSISETNTLSSVKCPKEPNLMRNKTNPLEDKNYISNNENWPKQLRSASKLSHKTINKKFHTTCKKVNPLSQHLGNQIREDLEPFDYLFEKSMNFIAIEPKMKLKHQNFFVAEERGYENLWEFWLHTHIRS